MARTMLTRTINHRDGTISFQCACGRAVRRVPSHQIARVAVGGDAECLICQDCEAEGLEAQSRQAHAERINAN